MYRNFALRSAGWAEMSKETIESEAVIHCPRSSEGALRTPSAVAVSAASLGRTTGRDAIQQRAHTLRRAVGTRRAAAISSPTITTGVQIKSKKQRR